jgi:hypothetical protein
MIDVKPFETDENISDDDDDAEEEEENEYEENKSDSDSEMRIDNETDGDSVMMPVKSLTKDKPKPESSPNEAKQRRIQLKSLRKLYLPNFCFVLVDMFSKMRMNKELIRISDIIASEQYKLYTLFDSKQLKCFLSKVSDASIALLDQDDDFLGY